MQVVFRADASAQIGTGHVMRCLTLAGALQARGWAPSLVGHFPAGLATLAEGAGVAVEHLPDSLAFEAEPRYLAAAGLTQGADVIVTDHYMLTATWHRAVAGQARVLMAIDDLARDAQAVDLVLNQNLGATPERYRGLVPSEAIVLVGPHYALLRPEFARERRRRRRATGPIGRILVFLSGSDEHDVTRRAAAAALVADVPVDVVVGSAYRFHADLEAWAATRPQVQLHRATDTMASLMAGADLAIGAPSSASWERCTLGLATIMVTLAENQLEVAARLAEAGAAISLGWHSGVSDRQLEDAVRAAVRDPARVRAMGRKAARIADGRGAERVVGVLEALVEARTGPGADAAADHGAAE